MLKVTHEAGSRVLRFTDGDESLDVLVNYTGDGNVGKGIFLDNKVIPALVNGVELQDKLASLVRKWKRESARARKFIGKDETRNEGMSKIEDIIYRQCAKDIERILKGN